MRFLMAVLWTLAALAQAPPTQPAAWEKPLAERRWEEAEPLLKSAIEAGETAPALRGLATVYRATGRLAEADPLLGKLVGLDETVKNIEELASVKAALGELERAEGLYRRSLELRSQAGEDQLK
jgi:tetratricopeptide (TPR) repeat protein